MGQRLQASQIRTSQFQTSQFQTWRSGDGEKLWLSMLIDAMKEVSRPEFRSAPCDRTVLAALRAQLARPVSAYGHYGSHFSLRN
jgi:hypothetical protein